MASKLSRADVLRVAELARLELSEAEVERFTDQLGDILAYAEQVQEVNTTGVAPTSHPLGIDASWRGDEPVASLPLDASLANAPQGDRERGLFKVPKVL